MSHPTVGVALFGPNVSKRVRVGDLLYEHNMRVLLCFRTILTTAHRNVGRIA